MTHLPDPILAVGDTLEPISSIISSANKEGKNSVIFLEAKANKKILVKIDTKDIILSTFSQLPMPDYL